MIIYVCDEAFIDAFCYALRRHTYEATAAHEANDEKFSWNLKLFKTATTKIFLC